MPAADGRRRTVRAGAAAVERLERRWQCAVVGIPAEFGPVGGNVGFYLVTVAARVEPAADEDWFALGRLRAGDVVSVEQSAVASARGTLWDPLVELYRAGNDPANPQFVAFDNDGGSGVDALVLEQVLPADDQYFVRARSFSVHQTGSYTLSAWVQTRAGRPESPGDSGGAMENGESEPNAAPSSANPISNRWREVRYVASWADEIGPTTPEDVRTLDLRAGDVVTVLVDSTQALDSAVSVLDDAGTVVATDRGVSNRRSGDVRDARVHALKVPSTGVYRVRVSGNDGTVGTYGVNVYLARDEASVVGRHVFYNNSIYDGRSPDARPADDAAVAPDKAALLQGQSATPAHVTNFSAGMNGIMIDVKDLHAVLTEADFEFQVSEVGAATQWVVAPRPAEVTQRSDAGINGSTRISIIWPDGAIVDRWLRVTLKATAVNGLVADDVFCFGNLAGDTGDDPAAAAVTAVDVMRIRGAQATRSNIRNGFDVNRDGRVNALDQAVARAHLSRRLPMFTAIETQQQPAFSEIPIPRPAPRRRSAYDPTTALLH